MFKKLTKHLAKRNLKKSIRLACESLYSENFDLDVVIDSIANRNNPKELFRAFTAIHTATELSSPLNETDLNNVMNEVEMVEKLSSTDADFTEILSLRKQLAELSWLSKQKEIFEGKLAHQANPYSYQAGVYMLEKSAKGPISDEQKKKIKELATSVEDSETKLAEYLDKKASEEAFDKWFEANVPKVARPEGSDYSNN